MNKKLLFFDIDGTLVGMDGKMPPSTVDALKKAQAMGHDIFLCTGRSKSQIYDFLIDFGFDGIVAAAGAYAEYKGKAIFHRPFGRENVRKVIDCFKNSNGGIAFQRVEECLSNDRADAPFIRAFSSNNIVISALKDIRTFKYLRRDNDFESYPDKYPDIESAFFCESELTVEEIRERVGDELCVEYASFRQPEPYSGEITLAVNNKGTGIQKILDHLGQSKEDVIAFGDGPNDYGMLDFAGLSVVMGNANDNVKAHGDYITDSVDKDGIYNALLKLELI